VFNVTKENVRKNASDISDLADEISALKRAMEKMQRELDKVAGVTPAELTLIKNRLDKAESEIVNMKRAIQDLQTKIRDLMKNAGK
jgi:chromosome segregation ATPase